LQVCNQIGNVAISVDPNATSAVLNTTRTVQATTQAGADQEFKRIAIEAQPPGASNNTSGCSGQNATATPTVGSTSTSGALTVNVTLPDSQGLLRNSSDSVDLSLSVPLSALPQDGSNILLDVEAPFGKVTVNGLSGVFDIRGSTGDIVVSNALLANGSHIETGQGNITFNGKLAIPTVSDPKNPPRFVLQCEKGNIDVTLPGTTSVTLDANTNVGSINSDVAINVQNNGGPVSYHGPLNAATPASPATLLLDVSTGNIAIHQQAA
jgi:hypothetical protein